MSKINIEKAEIKTAAVEVKTLNINGKQVTLSVFRQIKEEEILDADTMELQGVPWGTVNYFWGEVEHGDKLHLIWQKESELRRCIFYRYMDQNRYKRLYQICNRMYLLSINEDEEYGLLADIANTKEDILNKYREIFNDFEKLDHLFIAV